MTDRNRQTVSIVGLFSIAASLMVVGAGVWRLAAGFTTATLQHDQIFQMVRQNSEDARRNSEEQLKVLRRIEEKCK